VEKHYVVSRYFSDYSLIFKEQPVDVCIFAGGNGSVPYSITNPKEDFLINTENTYNLLDSVKLHQSQCKVIHTSSAAVYGNPMTLPVSEQHTVQPLSPYGWHKYFAELICTEFHALYGILTCSMRVFSVYGEGLRKQLFWDIYQKSLTDKKIELFGTGNESRDFIHISDLSKAYYCIIQNAAFNGECINVSSGIETTISEAAACFKNNYDSSIEIQFNQKVKQGDPVNWRANISLLNTFGFKSDIQLDEGMKMVTKWLRSI
jgi:UDP-glucose 4-epimerase